MERAFFCLEGMAKPLLLIAISTASLCFAVSTELPEKSLVEIVGLLHAVSSRIKLKYNSGEMMFLINVWFF